MNYVEHLNLFGVEAKEIPCIKGNGVPTTSTVGAVGLLYMNTSNGDLYKCVSETDGTYTWNIVGNNDTAYGDAVCYTKQTLEEAQKAQARENIGAIAQTDLQSDINIALTEAKAYADKVVEKAINGENYTNVLSTAINADGAEYIGSNGEDGYTTGSRLSTSSGTETTDSKYCCTGFIACASGDTIRVKNLRHNSAGGPGSVIFFRADRLPENRFIPPVYEEFFNDYLVDGVFTLTPDNCAPLKNVDVAYFRLSTGTIDENTIITINEEIGKNENGNEGGSTIDDETVEILMPSYAVATVGVEFNIYHKNIVWSTKPLECYGMKWTISNTSVSMQRFAECLRITPITADVGEHTLKLQVKNPVTNAVVAEKEMKLIICERTSVTGKNVVYMGDSLTFSRGGLYAAEIQHNLSNGGIVSVGTQVCAQATNQIGEVRHEGYNGATCGGFLKANVTSGFVNPFYNTSTNNFDFAQFVNTIGKPVHAVCLNLGANNLGNHEQGVADLQTIITKIRSYSADLPIIVSLAVQMAGQDSWRAGTYTATEMRYHWRNLIKAYLAAFDNGADNVYISTPYFNVDSDCDFPVETVARCARDTTQISRQNDSLHPTRIGTLKMADSYYATVLYVVAKGYEPDEPDIPDIPEPTVVNLVDPSTANDASPDTTTLFKDEWLNGYYLSAATISARDGCIVTDLFPLTHTQKIKVEGILLNTAEQKNRFRWWLFNADGSRGWASYFNFANNEVGNGTIGDSSFDAANNTAIIDLSGLGTSIASTAYARFSCYIAGTNEDVVVTVVE